MRERESMCGVGVGVCDDVCVKGRRPTRRAANLRARWRFSKVSTLLSLPQKMSAEFGNDDRVGCDEWRYCFGL